MYRHRISSGYILWLHFSVRARLRRSLGTIRQMLTLHQFLEKIMDPDKTCESDKQLYICLHYLEEL